MEFQYSKIQAWKSWKINFIVIMESHGKLKFYITLISEIPDFQVMDFEKNGCGKSWKSHGILNVQRRCMNPVQFI